MPDTPQAPATPITLSPAPALPERTPLGPLLGVVLVLNTGVAAALWWAVPGWGGFWPIWVHSQCIGLAITTVAVLIGHLPGVREWTGVRATLAMMLPAAPLGFLMGHVLAARVFGLPSQWLTDGSATPAWLATVLATGLAGLVLWGRGRIRGEEAARVQAQQLATEAELRLLRAQLEPHMLFNTLANLRALMAEDPPAAQKMLDNLIVFLRGTLAASRTERTTLAEEFGRLRAYLELMGTRMGQRLSWRLELPDTLATTSLPPMLLQPLVENAIKHGLEPQRGPGSIEVVATSAPGAVVITVADTGRGLVAPAIATAADDGGGGPPAPAEPPGRYGLHHVRERLRAAFGAAATLELQPRSPHGVSAIVRLPA